MANHHQPTPEELKAQEEEAIKAAEALENDPSKLHEEEDPEVKPDETPQPDDTPEPEPKPDEEEEQAEPSEEEKEALKQKLEAEKKKSSASARENQKILAKNRVINKALVEADEIPEPTEEEMAKEFKDWDMMTETEKMLAKETVISRNWRKKIAEAKEQATKIEKWNDSVSSFIEDPETLNNNPGLEGKTEEFKVFATQEANNSVPFKILVSAFLHDQGTGKPSNKGRMFERGSGGPNSKPQSKSGKVSLEEARKIRETNYPRWVELNKKGLIDYNL